MSCVFCADLARQCVVCRPLQQLPLSLLLNLFSNRAYVRGFLSSSFAALIFDYYYAHILVYAAFYVLRYLCAVRAQCAMCH